MSDVTTGKARLIRDCVRRVSTVDPGTLEGLQGDLLAQESIVLNVQRACQAAIDLATHIVQQRAIGPPNDSRDAFHRLENEGLLPSDLSASLKAMVGFRNIAVHRYHELDLRVLRAIIDRRLSYLLRFADLVNDTP